MGQAFTARPFGDVFRIDFQDLDFGWERDALFSSCQHLDSRHCKQKLFRKVMEDACERDAPIVFLGDLFDAMQGRSDRRGHKSAVRPELQGSDYFTRLRKYVFEQIEPFASNIKVIVRGNHETAIIRHNEIDLVGELCDMVQDKTGKECFAAPYDGAVIFGFRWRGTVQQQFTVAYTHGNGGNAKRSKGVLRADMDQASVLADAHISGHVHQQWAVKTMRRRYTTNGREVHDSVWHLSCPSMKGLGQWEKEKGFLPPPMGAWLARFHLSGDDRVSMRPIPTVDC